MRVQRSICWLTTQHWTSMQLSTLPCPIIPQTTVASIMYAYIMYFSQKCRDKFCSYYFMAVAPPHIFTCSTLNSNHFVTYSVGTSCTFIKSSTCRKYIMIAGHEPTDLKNMKLAYYESRDNKSMGCCFIMSWSESCVHIRHPNVLIFIEVTVN